MEIAGKHISLHRRDGTYGIYRNSETNLAYLQDNISYSYGVTCPDVAHCAGDVASSYQSEGYQLFH